MIANGNAMASRTPKKQILLKVTPEELADVDRVRGDVPRARWMRALMRDAVLAHDMTRKGVVHRAGLRPEAPPGRPRSLVPRDGGRRFGGQ